MAELLRASLPNLAGTCRLCVMPLVLHMDSTLGILTLYLVSLKTQLRGNSQLEAIAKPT